MVHLLLFMVPGTGHLNHRKDFWLLSFLSKMENPAVNGKYLRMNLREDRTYVLRAEPNIVPADLAQGPDGSIYVTDDPRRKDLENHLFRKIE